MTIWTSRSFAALGIVSMLGACDPTNAEGGLLASLTPTEDTALPPPPLKQALMMRGKVTLVPPSGYCIDPKSLSQSFALMARCDSLGAATGSRGAPIGLLTVSLARNAEAAALPTAQDLATASDMSAPKGTRQGEASVIFQAIGKAPATDLSPTHWRSVAHVGQFTMGAALFGPIGQRAVSAEGAEVLEEMIMRTTQKSNAG